MRILFLSTYFPVPANSGQAMRTQSLIQALAAEGHHISFLSFSPTEPPEKLAPLSGWCGSVEVVRRQHASVSENLNVFGRFIALVTSCSYAESRFRSPTMQNRIKHLLGESFDLIFADSVYALVNLGPTTVPIVLNCHNMEWIILQRYSELERNLLKRWYARLEARRLRVTEEKAFVHSNAVIVCSELERTGLHHLWPELAVIVVPNAVDCEFYSSGTSGEKPSFPTLLFQGGMDWYPNRDAVNHFIDRIFPRIRKGSPGVRFLIAGRNPPKKFVEKLGSSEDIKFTGTVPDMRPYLAVAALVVVPLRIGGGTRLKILEASAAGKAVVSTSVGAEGLDFQSGKEIIIADTPEEFADAVLRLLLEPDELRNIGERARRKVCESHNLANVRDGIVRVVANVAGTVRRPKEPKLV